MLAYSLTIQHSKCIPFNIITWLCCQRW